MLLTVSTNITSITYDMDIPADIPCKKIVKDYSDIISRVLNKDIDYTRLSLVSNRLGRTLSSEESLGDAGIWNGDYIVIAYS